MAEVTVGEKWCARCVKHLMAAMSGETDFAVICNECKRELIDTIFQDEQERWAMHETLDEIEADAEGEETLTETEEEGDGDEEDKEDKEDEDDDESLPSFKRLKRSVPRQEDAHYAAKKRN
jgi:hypothetical protein